MNLFKTSFGKQLCTIFLCLLLSLGCFSPVALAQSVPENPLAIAAQVNIDRLLNVSHLVHGQHLIPASFWIFKRKSKTNDGAPTETGTAGRRGPCHELNQSFAALVPRRGLNSPDSLPGTAVGFTANVQPTTFVHLPDVSEFHSLTESSDFSAQFMVQQLQEQYEVDFLENPIEFVIPYQAGITAISFADLDLMLEPDRAYHWYLSIICDRNQPSRNPSVDAWLEVVNADEQRSLANEVSTITDALEKATFYIEQDLWHEAVTLLTALRCQAPGNARYKENLQELLSDLFLDNDIEAGIRNKIIEAVETQSCPTQLRLTTN